MADASVGSRKRSGAEGMAPGTDGTEELFTLPWPGPGNGEGPVDPDLWSVQPEGESSTGASGLAAPPGPGR